MELIDRISSVENELNMVKSEIKKVLVDLREALNSNENPFTHLDKLQLGGDSAISEERVRNLEETLEELRGLSGDSQLIDEERIKNLEEALEKLRGLSGDSQLINEERIKNLEERVEELKEMGGTSGVDKGVLQRVEATLQELNELSSVEVERLKNLEAAIERMSEIKTEVRSDKSLFHNMAAIESGLYVNNLGADVGSEMESGTVKSRMDTLTLAQLIQWADRTLHLIGVEKLHHIIELCELTGRFSKEMKDTIVKIAELPAVNVDPEKEHAETKYCILALFELDRILTGENQELFTLLRELC